jgi:hypothetical protein
MVIGTPRKLLTTALFLFANSAWAGASFYADAGASGVEIHTPAPFWGFGVPSASLGYGLNYGIWTTFSTNEPVINLQFGIQDRYESATGNGASYGYMAAYPELRLQISRLYFTAGYTPFVMKSLDYNGTSTGLSRVSDATAYLGEAGILFPITPKVSFGLLLPPVTPFYVFISVSVTALMVRANFMVGDIHSAVIKGEFA